MRNGVSKSWKRFASGLSSSPSFQALKDRVRHHSSARIRPEGEKIVRKVK
jgi:hypothetical protein